MANGPFQDVFPIESGDIPASYVSLPAYLRVPLVCYVSIGRNCQDPGFALSILPQEAERFKLRHSELQGFRMSAPKVGIRQGFPYESWVVFGWSLLLGVSHPTTICHPENERRVSEAPIPSMGLVYLPTFTYNIYLHLP